MIPEQSYIESLQVLTPLLVSAFALIATSIGAIGLYVGQKSAIVGQENARAIGDIHVIVNSQKTEMLEEIKRLKLKVEVLEISKSQLKVEVMETSQALVTSRAMEAETKQIADIPRTID